eukprot:scaffold35327_cov90-Isochrysis_galbana.AAC.1
MILVTPVASNVPAPIVASGRVEEAKRTSRPATTILYRQRRCDEGLFETSRGVTHACRPMAANIYKYPAKGAILTSANLVGRGVRRRGAGAACRPPAANTSRGRRSSKCGRYSAATRRDQQATSHPRPYLGGVGQGMRG